MSGGYFLATLINNALPFLLLPVLTSYLNPDAYANIALFTAYVAIINAISGSTIQLYITKFFFKQPKNEIAKIIGNGVFVVFVLNILIMLVLVLSYQPLADFYGLPVIWMLLIPLNSFAYILFNVLLTVFRNQKKVLSFGVNQIANTSINFIATLLLVSVFLVGWEGRIIGIILSNIISAIVALYILRTNGYFNLCFKYNLFKNFIRFLTTLLPNSLQSVIGNRIGVLFLQLFFTKEILGIYSVGYQIAYVVMIIIVTLNLSWSPFIFEELSKNNSANKSNIVRMFYMHFSIVIAAFLFVNLASGTVIRVMSTPDYYSADQFIIWLSLGMIFNGLSIFIQPVLIHYDYQSFIGRISIVSLVIMLLVHYIGVYYFGYMGVAYAYCLTYFVIFMSFFLKSKRILNLFVI